MPRPKESTQFIFDDLERTKNTGSYGYVSQMFRIFRAIALIRQDRGISQHDLAKLTEIPQSTIAKIESGKTNPSLFQLVKIAHALGTRIRFQELSEEEKAATKDVDMGSFVE